MTVRDAFATSLTPAQQAVVNHDKGPALVYAVAGAGKTTALIHRIERLVREGVFAPREILATSFGKGNEWDLRARLAQWPHCAAVHVHTLHALGRRIIVQAQQAGYWPQLTLDAREDSAELDQRLLTIAINEARQRQEPWAPELETIDRHDFLSYVAACKGNLLYADLAMASLPAEARRQAGEATAPNVLLDWYLDLYWLYERARLQRGIVTFSDMLLSAWETLVRFPDVCRSVQAQYRCVLVDEFQDINLAQALILDLITAPERNYMAIGDDDQTIYEWRGANPRFILDFEQRYGAQRYIIDDNFRCPAGPLILANGVIAHNRQRAPKRLQLTQGFAGETTVQVYGDVAAMAHSIVHQIHSLQKQDIPWRDMAVLVRLNAQTPHIEQGLIAAGIPFRVSNPFYHRYEIRTLVYYVRLAWVEWARQQGQKLNAAQKDWFSEAWQAVYNRPRRYISRSLHDLVAQAVLKQDAAPTQALRLALAQAPHDGVADNMELLAEDLAWLASRLTADAAESLDELERRLDYKSYLLDSSGFPQTGEGRAAGVTALIDYARGKGTVLEFVQHLRSLARQKIGRERAEMTDAVTLTTIHGAKGLEWPVVFLAQCNREIMPFDGQRTANMEEERRLFYVALTRSQRHLHLYAVRNQPLSPFLAEAGWQQALPELQNVKKLLRQQASAWQPADCWAVARFVSRHRLERYFQRWWQLPAPRLQDVVTTLLTFLTAVAEQDGWAALELPPSTLEFWQSLLPQEAPFAAAEIPGLAKWLRTHVLQEHNPQP